MKKLEDMTLTEVRDKEMVNFMNRMMKGEIEGGLFNIMHATVMWKEACEKAGKKAYLMKMD